MCVLLGIRRKLDGGNASFSHCISTLHYAQGSPSVSCCKQQAQALLCNSGWRHALKKLYKSILLKETCVWHFSDHMFWFCSSPSPSNGATLLGSSDGGTHFEWRSPDEAVRRPFEGELASAAEVASQYDLCLSGDALHTLQQRGIDTTYVPLTQVCPGAIPVSGDVSYV